MLQTAIILAGGFGTRLKTVISNVPKPMAPVNGLPFLTYLLRYLKHYEVKNVVFSTGHLAEKVEEYYGSNFEGLDLSYAAETTPLGTGGAIRLALGQAEGENVLVLNGDSFFDVNLNEFFKHHIVSKAEMSLALREVTDASRYGTIAIRADNRISSFREKSSSAAPGLINGGVYIICKDIYQQNTEGNGAFSIEKDFFEKYNKTIKMMGFEFDGYFIDIGIPDDYNKAQDDFKEFKYK